MSKNRNRSKLNKTTNSRVYKLLNMNLVYPIYWDEGIPTYPKLRLGFKNPKKVLMKYEIRMYRSWKYNRKKQWRVA